MSVSQKVEMALTVSDLVTRWGNLTNEIRGVADMWNDKEYGTTGNKITNADLSGSTDIITEEQLDEWTPLANNYIKWLDNNSPSAYDYQQRINLIRDETFST